MKTHEEYEKLISQLKEDISNLKKQKKYGLVWEEQPEDNIDNKNTIPLLINQPNKAILTDMNKPINLLIEGDNYDSLKSLLFTHKGKIDVIYIDPPYNTGNKDFIYNDHYVDKEDNYKHSKWLSFMKKRLTLAKELLSNEGFMVISIDDNEMAQLKLLMDQIFGEENSLGVLPTIMNLKGNQDQFGFAGTHEYTIVYAKNKISCKINEFPIENLEELKDWEVDLKGFFKRGANLKATGVNAPREKRPNLFFPIYISVEGEVSTERKSENDIELFPITNGQEMSWRWSKGKVEKESEDIIVVKTNDSFSLYKKQRPVDGELPSKKAKSLFYKPEYSSGNGTNLLKDILGEKKFNNPKPLFLIKDFLILFSHKNSIILDFFAGSGTTGHATLKLNVKDGGNRKFILCTNNENNICEEVTYERNKRVIQGYTNSKGKEIEGLGGNLKYLKVHNEDISEISINDSKKESIRNLSEQLFIIRENTHYQIHNEDGFSIYTNPEGNITGILYDTKFFVEFTEKLEDYRNNEKALYMFSWTNTTYEELVQEISSQLEQVRFEPIPENILSFYRNHKEVL